jgi:hypothetical protein
MGYQQPDKEMKDGQLVHVVGKVIRTLVVRQLYLLMEEALPGLGMKSTFTNKVPAGW